MKISMEELHAIVVESAAAYNHELWAGHPEETARNARDHAVLNHLHDMHLSALLKPMQAVQAAQRATAGDDFGGSLRS